MMNGNVGKLLGVVVVLIVGVVGWALYNQQAAPPSRVDLQRPLVVGVVSWPGYAGGIVANGGFKPNSESIYTKKYGLPVKFVLIEDIDARGKAFAKGGPGGVDVVWSTIDFWANELPNFVAGGVPAKAFLQVDWSRGGDALVASEEIKKIEDLKGKKIVLTQFTPSHWLLETLLGRAKLSAQEKEQIRDELVFTQDVPSARAAFISEHVDATVVWEPDVKQALKRPGSHILTSTQELPNIIADVMVAKESFIEEYPEALEAFVRGWLDGVEEAKKDPARAAQILADNEPLFADLGLEETEKSLDWVYWPDLNDNRRMFGLDGKAAQFDQLFTQASQTWQALGVVTDPVAASEAKDDSILRRVIE